MTNTNWGAIPRSLAESVSLMLNKKLGVSTGFKPSEWANAINLLGELPVKTASGAIASFSDGADRVQLDSLLLTGNPVQESGTPSPTSPLPISGFTGLSLYHAGKNFIDDNISNLEQGSIRGSNGTNSDAANRVRNSVMTPFPYDYIYSNYKLTIPSGWRIAVRGYDKNGNYVNTTAQGFLTSLSPQYVGKGVVYCRFVFAKTDDSDITPQDAKNIGFQIEYGASATAYEPYKNPVITAINWLEVAGTVYGFTLDKSGLLTFLYALSLFSSFEWSEHSTIANTYYANITGAVTPTTGVVADAKCSSYDVVSRNNQTSNSPNNTLSISNAQGGRIFVIDTSFSSLTEFVQATKDYQLLYKLATPITYQLDAEEVAKLEALLTYLGSNNFWHNANGDTALSYRASIT